MRPDSNTILSLVCPTLESPKHFFDRLLQERPFEDLSCEEKKSWEKIEFVIVSPKYFDLVDFNQIAIHQITDKQAGIYAALNLGISFASAPFVLIANIDDFIDLYSAVKVLEDIPSEQVSAIYGDTLLIEDTSENRISIPGTVNCNTINNARMPASHQAQIILKSEYERLSGFRLQLGYRFMKIDLKYASDFDFYCRSVLTGGEWKLDRRIKATQLMGGTTSKFWLRTTLEILFLTFVHSGKKLRITPALGQHLLGAIRFHYPRQLKRRKMLSKGEQK
jgi:hypothetical protein